MRLNSEVRLEPLQAAHAEGMFEGLSDPAGYLFLPDDPPVDLASLRGRYARQVRGRSSDGLEVWLNWVARRASSGALVGYTQATLRDRVAHVAYHIFPAYWRQGLGTAAMRMTLGLLDEADLVDEARALVDTRNEASIALLQKLGFNLLGTFVGADHFKGRGSDEHEFALAMRATTRRA